MSKITNDNLTLTVWHMILCSCTHMATVGVKGLISHKCNKSAVIKWRQTGNVRSVQTSESIWQEGLCCSSLSRRRQVETASANPTHTSTMHYL